VPEHTPYQRQVIRRYYERQPEILRQRLGELVTELFLAEGKKRQRLWERAENDLEKLGVPRKRIDHLLKKADPALLAELLQELDKKD
jgi:hypothetical protein